MDYYKTESGSDRNTSFRIFIQDNKQQEKMKDNFDLTKFLKENKVFEQFNPFLTESKDKEKMMRDKIREMILSELDINDTTDAYDPVEEAFNIFKNNYP